jgi:hypothetical protein
MKVHFTLTQINIIKGQDGRGPFKSDLELYPCWATSVAKAKKGGTGIKHGNLKAPGVYKFSDKLAELNFGAEQFGVVALFFFEADQGETPVRNFFNTNPDIPGLEKLEEFSGQHSAILDAWAFVYAGYALGGPIGIAVGLALFVARDIGSTPDDQYGSWIIGASVDGGKVKFSLGTQAPSSISLDARAEIAPGETKPVAVLHFGSADKRNIIEYHISAAVTA